MTKTQSKRAFSNKNEFKQNHTDQNSGNIINNKKELIGSVELQQNSILPILNFQLENIEINTLVDSGASLSLISPNLFEKIKQTRIKIHYLSRNVVIHTLNNSTIPFKSCIKINFKLGGVFVTGHFYITKQDFPKGYQMIIGYDFLKNNSMILDCNENQLKFKHVTLDLKLPNKQQHQEFYKNNSTTQNSVKNSVSFNNENNDSNHRNPQEQNQVTHNKHQNNIIMSKEFDGILLRKEIFEPNECKYVEIRCPNDLKLNQDICIDPIKNRSGIQIEATITEIKELTPISIKATNLTNKKITLNKHTKIAKIHTDMLMNNDFQNSKNSNNMEYSLNNMRAEDIKKLRRQQLKREDFEVSHLDKSLQNKFLDLLLKKAEAFSKDYITLGNTSLVEPKFKLAHDYPIQARPYKIPQNVQQFAKEEIRKMLEANIIEETNSNYASPVIFVKKKANPTNNNNEQIKYRMAVDYRLLNSILENTPYPVPEVREILQSISGKQFYTVVDFHAAFLQINVKPEDRDKLAFITEFGKFRPKTVPFGTRISSLIWAELIDKVLGHLDKSKVRYFMDDVVIAADSEEEMLKILEEILNILIEQNLTIDPRKMQLCCNQIEFLGYSVNKDGYSPSVKNREKVQNLARPRNKKDILRFLGFCNYFKIMLRDYNTKIMPLLELTKQNAKFRWTEVEEAAFEQIQNDILSNPVIRPPDLNKDFYIITDASNVAISAILSQKIGENLLPIEFYGRKLNDAEKRYPSMKLELLGIHNGIMHFKNLLWGKKVHVLTDSKSLTYHINLQKQPDIVARWILDLQDFDLNFQHIQGIENPTDYLSRHIMAIDSKEIEQNLFQLEKRLTNDNIAKYQAQDPNLIKIIENLKTKKNYKFTRKYALLSSDLLVLKDKDENYQNPIFIAPEELKQIIIQTAHRPHFAFRKTYEMIKERFFWTGMYKDVKYFCAKCEDCNKFKAHNTINIPLQKMEKDYTCGESIHIDLIGKLPVSLKRNQWALTIVDTFSRYLEVIPIPNTNTKTILTQLNNYFGRYGLAKYINCDNATMFHSKEFKEYAQNLGIEVRYSSKYFPRSNGAVERCHRILKDSIAAMCQKTYDWDTLLPFFKLHYNDSKHRATQFKPSTLFFGRSIRTPFTNFREPELTTHTDFARNVKKHIQLIRKEALANMNKMQEEYNRNNNFKPKYLNLDDEVYLKALRGARTFENKFDGPYIITRILRNNNYIIQKKHPQKGDKTHKVHITKLFLTPK